MITLNNGCSFSTRSTLKKNRTAKRVSYCDYLPAPVYNIADPGSGIDTTRINDFLTFGRVPGKPFSTRNRNLKLTHLIWQVPSPARQPLCKDYSISDFYSAPIEMRQYIIQKYGDISDYQLYNPVGSHYKVHDHEFLWTVLRFCKTGKGKDVRHIIDRSRQTTFAPGSNWDFDFNNTAPPSSQKLYTGKQGKRRQITIQDIHNIMDRRYFFYEKAIRAIKYNVDLIRSKFPEIKIIFLRYEETLLLFIEEFQKMFYKETLSNYCKENDITYIYEENFHTKWFDKHNMTFDQRHVNVDGAKLIADKIKEYL